MSEGDGPSEAERRALRRTEEDAAKKEPSAEPAADPAAASSTAAPEGPQPEHRSEEVIDETAWEGVKPPVHEEDEEDEDAPKPRSPEAELEGVVEGDDDGDEDDDEDDEDAEDEPEEQRFEFKPTATGIRVKPGVFSSMEGLESELAETRAAVERFTIDAAKAVGADVRPENGHLYVHFPREVPRGVRRKRRLVFELSKMERDATELAAPGSRFLRELASMVQSRAPVGVAGAAVEKPLNLFHYRVHMAALHYKFEDVVTVCLDDIGLREEAPLAPALQPSPHGGLGGEPDLELLEDAAKRSLMKQIAPKLDELSSAVTAGMEAALKRITRYYGQLREEARFEEAKVRRRIGELNARLWFTEDGLRERRMERERDDHQRSLAEIRQKNKHRLEELEAEEAVRLSRESEKHRPAVRLELVGITRVVPSGAAASPSADAPSGSDS